MKHRLFLWLVLICLALNATADEANGKPPVSETEAAVNRILKEDDAKLVYGPANVKLGGVASMSIQLGQSFIPPETALKIFSALGEDRKRYEGLVGLIVPGLPGDETPTDSWGMVGLFYRQMGFVRDADARTWDATKLLEGLRKTVDSRNEEMRKRGRPEMEVVGWIEQPRYEQATHRLLWAISEQEKSKPNTALATYNAVALGREGLIAFTFVTEAGKLAERKGIATGLLSGVEFNPGKRYEDFTEGTDRVAEIGLAALVGGVAAKKLGLIAVVAAVLAKWGKVIGAAVGGLAWFKLKKKKQQQNGLVEVPGDKREEKAERS